MADTLPDIENFRIDPNQYLGHDFEDFQNILQAFSLTSPKGYLMMKSEVAKKLKRDAIRNLFSMSSVFIPRSSTNFIGFLVFVSFLLASKSLLL